MSLGIKREKFGDLVLDNQSCFGALCEDILDYVLLNLNQVGKCPCTVEVIEELETENIKTASENFVLTSTSLRLDSIVSSICNLSRSKAVDIIHNGKVLLDYVEVKEKDKLVNINEALTIRGYGKYKIIEEIGSTQRGRLRLLVKKYV
jgi:RNA-binding protein YlmH